MSEWPNSDNPFIDSESLYTTSFKPLPLPDDFLGFNGVIEPSISPSVTLKSQHQLAQLTQPEQLVQSAQSTQQEQHQNEQGDDLESILFDLGISDAYETSQNPSSETLPSTSSSTNDHGFSKSHTRKISGSGIFGFVGTGSETQLSIPGLYPESIPIENKKPVYRNVERFDNLDFTKSHMDPSLSEKPVVDEMSGPDYFFTGDPNGKFKFPRSPMSVTPPASFHPVTATYSAQDLQTLRHYHSNLEGYSARKAATAPDLLVLQSSPTKEVNSVEDIERLMNGREVKLLPRNQRPQPQQSLLPEVHLPPPPPPSVSPQRNNSFGDETTFSSRSNFSTPLKVKNTFMDMKTPSPQKPPKTLNWIPTLITKKNNFSEKILKEQARSPTRKKRPTIKSTLATGTLDKYFVGPDDEKMYTCKYEGCNKTFTRISNIRAHIQTHLSDRPFVCPVCKKAFVRNHDLRRHYKGHLEYQYVCPCGKKFPRQDALKRHRIRNICKGGISDEKGVLKRKRSKAKKNSSTSHLTSSSASSKLISRIDSQISSKPVQEVVRSVHQWPEKTTLPTIFADASPVQGLTMNMFAAQDPSHTGNVCSEQDSFDPANMMLENGIDISMDYSFGLEDITTS
ncbi:hypothetical protein FOA43_004018 [Brettanomyces nanus]|uniref:C2H2-type domain-containing protein n=1 Tax=Eeniella nana TaxID=13502 RepID=A0A875S5N6_EENNA|nr:uncharacterized protein FOA43_004018 [Brettanomyces nanus]QPG76626.1 hypothetical protein FOA43_004018 [Brettanomyces nanus]